MVLHYAKMILLSNSLSNSLQELSGQTLGCWCAPKLCHGDVLLQMYKDSLVVLIIWIMKFVFKVDFYNVLFGIFLNIQDCPHMVCQILGNATFPNFFLNMNCHNEKQI